MKTTAFLSTVIIANVAAFAPINQGTQFRVESIQATKNSFDPLNLSEDNQINIMDSIPKIAAASAAAIALHPLAALAEETDDYEYGAVSAPIGIAWGVGLLAILTALLPLALKGGEEAFEEMRENDSEGWGTGNSDKLKKRR